MSSRAPLVSVIHPGMHVLGGAEHFAAYLVTALARNGIPVELITGTVHTRWKSVFATHTSMITVKELGIPLGGVRFWLALPWYAKRLQSLIDVRSKVLVATNIPATWAGVNFAKKYGVPVIWYCHEPFRLFYDSEALRLLPPFDRVFFSIVRRAYERIDQKLSRGVDAVLANSYFTARRVQDVYHIDPEKITVKYTGPDLSVFSPVSTSPPLIGRARAQGNGVIFCPGGVGRSKNPMNNLRALSLLKDDTFIAIFTGGRRNEVAAFRRAVSRMGLGEKVVWFPRISLEEMPAYYTFSDVTLYTPHGEPFGLVQLESLACGTCVVVSNSGGMPETVEDGISGYLVDSSSPSAIADGLARVLSSPIESEEMAREGQRRVREQFDLHVGMENIVRHLIATKRENAACGPE